MNNGMTLIIATLNRPDDLKNTIQSYLRQKTLPDEVIVVDQSSSEIARKQIIDYVNTIESFKIKYIYQDVPSLTYARNNGVKNASYDILVFSDDDIELVEDTLGEVKKIMKSPKYALVAGRDILSLNSKPRLAGYLLFFRSFFKRNQGHISHGVLGRFPLTNKKACITEWAMGFFFSVKKSLLEKFHISWDEKLIKYAYPEDLVFSYEYCTKARKAGLLSIMSPNIKVKHLCSKIGRISSFSNDLFFVVNRAYMISKLKLNIFYKLGYSVVNYVILITRILRRDNYKAFARCLKIKRKYNREIKLGQLNIIYEQYL